MMGETNCFSEEIQDRKEIQDRLQEQRALECDYLNNEQQSRRRESTNGVDNEEQSRRTESTNRDANPASSKSELIGLKGREIKIDLINLEREFTKNYYYYYKTSPYSRAESREFVQGVESI